MQDANVVMVGRQKCLFDFMSLAQREELLESFDFEKEFSIVLKSAQEEHLQQEVHYVNRVKKMRLLDSENFFSLAAATVVACFRRNPIKIDKYREINLCLIKARAAADSELPNEAAALAQIEQLTESIIDIFDC